MEMNKFHDEDEQTIYTNLKELGHEIYTPTSDELKLWENAAKPVQENWIESLEKKGLPGRKIFNALIDTIADVKSTGKKKTLCRQGIQSLASQRGPTLLKFRSPDGEYLLVDWSEIRRQIGRHKIQE
jgi:hypothetical protein